MPNLNCNFESKYTLRTQFKGSFAGAGGARAISQGNRIIDYYPKIAVAITMFYVYLLAVALRIKNNLLPRTPREVAVFSKLRFKLGRLVVTHSFFMPRVRRS